MKVFAIIHRPGGDNAQAYDVTDEELATQSLDSLGYPYDIITEEEYNAWLEEHSGPHGD